MKRRCLLTVAACAAGLWSASTASALPIMQVFIDTPFTFNARVSDGDVLAGWNAFPPLIGGVNWTLNVSVRSFGAVGNDWVDVLGTLQHINPPHGEGPGAQFQFYFAFWSLGLANGFHGMGDTGPVLAWHGNHIDTFRAFATAEVVAGQFVSWHVDVRGEHSDGIFPAPGTAALGALAPIVIARRRRR